MTGIEKNKFHYFLLYLKIKKKITLRRWPWILLGSWMSVQWQKIMCWFSSYTKKTKTKTKTFFHRCLNETNLKQKNMFLKVPSVPKGRGWGSSMFFFFELNYVYKVSSEPQIQWILWLIIEFFENSELSKRNWNVGASNSHWCFSDPRTREKRKIGGAFTSSNKSDSSKLWNCSQLLLQRLGKKIQLYIFFRTRKSKTMSRKNWVTEVSESANRIIIKQKIKTLNHNVKIHKHSRKIMD